MEKDKRNSIHIFYKVNDKEVKETLWPENVDWREFHWKDAYDLYNTMWTTICKHFNVDVTDTLPYVIRACWDCLRIVDEEPTKGTWEEDAYKLYLDMFVESECATCADSMYSDAYITLRHACTHNGDEDMDDGVTDGEYKDLCWLNYLFYDIMHYPSGRVDVGSWIFKDGSYICLDSAQHRRFMEEFCGIDEWTAEREFVKVSIYRVYTHPYMTKAQWATVNKFCEKYQLNEANQDWLKSTRG